MEYNVIRKVIDLFRTLSVGMFERGISLQKTWPTGVLADPLKTKTFIHLSIFILWGLSRTIPKVPHAYFRFFFLCAPPLQIAAAFAKLWSWNVFKNAKGETKWQTLYQLFWCLFFKKTKSLNFLPISQPLKNPLCLLYIIAPHSLFLSSQNN